MTEAAVPRPGAPDPFCAIPDLAGPNYIRFAATLHGILRPTSYLELGTGRGDLVRLARCATVAVDPALDLAGDVLTGKPSCFLFRQDSDSFFRSHDPAALLGQPVGLAFLDGPRLFERLLREFAAVERCCARNSIVLLHDCIPTDSHIARRVEADERFASRSPHPSWWAGDVWKAAALLKRYRTDLTIYAFNTPPTGLLAITGLDPASTMIDDHYFALVREGMRNLDTPADMLAFFNTLDMRPADEYGTAETLSELFAF